MLKIALIALLVALLAGVVGLGGVSNFALGVSKVFFSIWGLLVLLAVIGAVLLWRTFMTPA